MALITPTRGLRSSRPEAPEEFVLQPALAPVPTIPTEAANRLDLGLFDGAVLEVDLTLGSLSSVSLVPEFADRDEDPDYMRMPLRNPLDDGTILVRPAALRLDRDGRIHIPLKKAARLMRLLIQGEGDNTGSSITISAIGAADIEEFAGAPGAFREGVEYLETDPDVDFAGAIVQNAAEHADIPGLTRDIGAVESVTLVAQENLDYEVVFWSKDTREGAGPGTDSFIDYVPLAASLGKRIAGAGPFRYALTGLAIPYRDDDATRELHVSLVVRSAAGKSAAPAGAVRLRVGFRPSGGV